MAQELLEVDEETSVTRLPSGGAISSRPAATRDRGGDRASDENGVQMLVPNRAPGTPNNMSRNPGVRVHPPPEPGSIRRLGSKGRETEQGKFIPPNQSMILINIDDQGPTFQKFNGKGEGSRVHRWSFEETGAKSALQRGLENNGITLEQTEEDGTKTLTLKAEDPRNIRFHVRGNEKLNKEIEEIRREAIRNGQPFSVAVTNEPNGIKYQIGDREFTIKSRVQPPLENERVELPFPQGRNDNRRDDWEFADGQTLDDRPHDREPRSLAG